MFCWTFHPFHLFHSLTGTTLTFVKNKLFPPFACFIVTLILAQVSHANVDEPATSWIVDFEKNIPGPYSEAKLSREFPKTDWTEGLERTAIVVDADESHHQVLEVVYPKGAVGPRVGGAQFTVPLKPTEHYTLSYDFCLSDDFDFRLGGKLPGLTSGGSTYTGGHKPDQGQGWSARFMWRPKGQMVLYLYSIDMKGKWGDDHVLNMPQLERGRWYHVTQEISLNHPTESDGKITVWVDGNKVLDLKNLRLRIGAQGYIDTFYFSTFFGGNSPEWGPRNDSRIRFDNFEVQGSR